MSNFFRDSANVRFYSFLTLVGTLSLLSSAYVPPSAIEAPGVHSPDPTVDIPWKSGVGYAGVANIRAAFNHGRIEENFQSGTDIPLITRMPAQSAWEAMSDNAKALWLINSEREARGLHPLHGTERNVTGVAQDFANWMLANDKWGHNSDGKGPPGRLEQNPKIASCHNNFLLMENLYAFGTTTGCVKSPIARAIYNWMYNDSGKGWGHRHLLLYHSFFENSGPGDREGLMGIGRALGGPYTINNTSYPYAEVIVLNMFDPCKKWRYNAPFRSPGIYYLRSRCT